MPTTASGIWSPEDGTKYDLPGITATMTSSIEDVIGPTVKDTGWVDVVLRPGFVAQGGLPPQVRRVGKRVEWRWGVTSAGLNINSVAVIADIPEEFRPDKYSVYGYAASSNVAASGQIYVNPGGVVYIRTAATLGSYYVAHLSWFVG